MSRTRRNFSAKFKSELVIELLKGEKNLNAIVLSIMKHAYTTIPGALWIVTAVVLFFYRLNKKRYNKIVEELKNGRKS